MAIWVLFSILTALFWAFGNIIDKFVFTRWVIKPVIPVIAGGILGLLASVIVYFTRGFDAMSGINIFLGMLAGFFTVLSFLFYYKAVNIEEISRVIPLYYLMNFFIVFFAFIFLGEILTSTKYLGVFFLATGAILVSQKDSINFKFNKAFWFMILASGTFAACSVLTKYLLNFADYWTVFSYIRIGVTVTLLPVLFLNFNDLAGEIKKNGAKAIALLSVSVILNVFAELFVTFAISVGSVTLVMALSSVQPFIVLVFALFISVFYPAIFKEDLKKVNIFIKVAATILVFIGVILIT
jgi:transporter family protein